MLAMLLPGDQLQVHLDGQRFAGKPQLLQQRGQRGSVGNLARLTVDGYLNASVHRLVSSLRRNLCAFCAHVSKRSGGPRSVVAVFPALKDATERVPPTLFGCG